MAGLGRKVWSAGDVLAAADLNGYVGDQVVMVFASAAARSSAIGTAVSAGMVSFRQDGTALEYYTGSAWAAVGVESSVSSSIITTPVTTLAATATAYTAGTADKNEYLYSLATATCTVTIPNSALAVGDSINIIRDGAGTVVIAAGSGVTSWAGAGTAGTAVTFKIDQQYNAATVLKVADATYRVVGKISA